MKPLEFLYLRRDLLWSMFDRQLKEEHKSSYLGHFWLVIQPVFMIVVYAYIMTPLLSVRWQSESVDNPYTFTIAIFCGFVIFEIFGASLSDSSRLISSHPNYVKKMVFPLFLFPLVNVAVSTYKSLLLLFLLIAFAWLAGYAPSLKLLLFPLIMLPIILLSLGISFLLSALGVFIPDLSNLCAVIRQAVFFLTPIIYPYSLLETNSMTMLAATPLAMMVEESRKLVFGYGEMNIAAVFYSCIAGLLALFIGLFVFRHLKSSFADVV